MLGRLIDEPLYGVVQHTAVVLVLTMMPKMPMLPRTLVGPSSNVGGDDRTNRRPPSRLACKSSSGARACVHDLRGHIMLYVRRDFE